MDVPESCFLRFPAKLLRPVEIRVREEAAVTTTELTGTECGGHGFEDRGLIESIQPDQEVQQRSES